MKYLFSFLWVLIYTVLSPIVYLFTFSFLMIFTYLWTLKFKENYKGIIKELGTFSNIWFYYTDKRNYLYSSNEYYKYCYPNVFIWFRDSIIYNRRDQYITKEYNQAKKDFSEKFEKTLGKLD